MKMKIEKALRIVRAARTELEKAGELLGSDEGLGDLICELDRSVGETIEGLDNALDECEDES